LGASSWLSRWGVGLDLGVQAPHWVWRLLKNKIFYFLKALFVLVGGAAEGEGERILSRFDRGLDLMTLRSRPEQKPGVGRSAVCATQAAP